MKQLSGKMTQTEQRSIGLALSWDFTQLFTFFSRSADYGHISKKFNPELRAGRTGRERE
jgi:hypothetical protein